MKIRTQYAILGLIWWQIFETPVCWAVWNFIISPKFGLPQFEYWQVMVLLLALPCLFPSSYGLFLAYIAEKLEGK